MTEQHLDRKIVNALRALKLGEPVDDTDLLIRRKAYSHKLDFATTASELQFFNQNNQNHVTNWPSQAGLPANHAFAVESIGFAFIGGRQVDGTAEADGLPYDTNGDASLDLANELYQVIMNGRVEFSLGDNKILDELGIWQFPAGGGVQISGALLNQASGADAAVANVLNGVPHKGNQWMFSPILDITPQRLVELSLSWNFTQALTDAMVIQANMTGQLITLRK